MYNFNTMKKMYEKPAIEFFTIDVTDVITTSDGECVGTDLLCLLNTCSSDIY